MLEKLKACYGKVVRVGGAGARCAIPMFLGHRGRQDGLVIAMSSDGSCVVVACLIAVRELRGADAAVAVRERMGTVKLSPSLKWPRRCSNWVGVCRCVM